MPLNVLCTAVRASHSQAKEFRLEAVAKRGPVFPFESMNNTVVSN